MDRAQEINSATQLHLHRVVSGATLFPVNFWEPDFSLYLD